jgi:SpoVK/Ycf46/Vps4 family AAA+-type ATPase
MTAEEIGIVLFFLQNIIQNGFTLDNAYKLISFISSEGANIFSKDILDSGNDDIEKLKNKKLDKRNFLTSHIYDEVELKTSTIKKMILASNPPNELPKSNYLIQLSDLISDTFYLNDNVCRDIIRFTVLRYLLPSISELANIFSLSYNFTSSSFSLFGSLLNYSEYDITRAFMLDSNLIINGLYEPRENNSKYNVSESLQKIIFNHAEAFESPKNVILGQKAHAELNKDDYDYLNNEFDFIAKLIDQALISKAIGINVLIYGVPGTGKTEITKAICSQINADLYSISEESKNTRSDNRISEMNMAKTLVNNDSRTVLMIDEAEDILCLQRENQAAYGKLYINRLLENNKTPIIWITNSIYKISDPILRRFSYALEMELPPLETRVRIWERMLAKADIHIPQPEITELATDYELSPSFAALSIRSAQLLGDKDVIRKTLDSLNYAITKKPREKTDEAKRDFNLELVNTDQDLKVLADRVVDAGALDFSLCLYGAPGTGKSAFARHLAEMMGLKVLHKRASDLFGMYVGENEKNIAQAFLEAKREKKFLIFDEADSFLQDRRNAQRSWEVSSVNEMLTWMESHPYPFACTTNLMESLDPASLRRFTFKVKYDFLTVNQATIAFKYFFGVDYPINIKNLTPGDFALVYKKVKTLAIKDPSIIADLLKKEVEIKGCGKQTMGFFS